MAFLVVLVLDDPDRCTSLLDAWDDAGAKGVTILESSGLARVRRAAYRDDLPLMPSLRNLLQGREEHHRTLFSVVEDEATVQALVDATQSVVGDLHQPHTGLLFVLALHQVIGLYGHDSSQEENL